MTGRPLEQLLRDSERLRAMHLSEIKKMMQNQGIKGISKDPFRCPLALLISKRVGYTCWTGDLHFGDGKWDESRLIWQPAGVQVDFSSAMFTFVRQFDIGDPRLDEFRSPSELRRCDEQRAYLGELSRPSY